VTGFTPVDDGMFGDRTDAFDDGLVLGVDGSGFDDLDGYAPVSLAEKIATGPSAMSGLSVSRVDEVLQQSPTMRSLVKLANPTATGKTVDVTIESNLGAHSWTGSPARCCRRSRTEASERGGGAGGAASCPSLLNGRTTDLPAATPNGLPLRAREQALHEVSLEREEHDQRYDEL
jgi:hypothetical protein